jgi:F0F1-type ATP synthase assembly protein I
MPESPEPDPGHRWARYMELSQVGTEMVAPIVIGLLADYKLGSGPWLTVVGAFLGFAFGMWHMLTILKRTDERPRQNPPSEGA